MSGVLGQDSFSRRRTDLTLLTRAFMVFFLVLGPAGCKKVQDTKGMTAKACMLTSPRWVKPPEDAAVLSSPAYGNYFVNEDHSIWTSASWAVQEEYALNVANEWIKVGWFRPAGAELIITSQRLDGEAPPLKAEASCCYPTRFQASGLYFPTGACWKVTANAAESELSFIVWVEP